MHTRRVGAFLMGGWLLGTLLMTFAVSQSLVNVDRIMNNPPPQVVKEFNDMGIHVTRQILRFEAQQLNRHLTETWQVIQFGIGGALLATAFLTTHRSRFVIGGATIMLVIVAYMYFSLTPNMTSLGRSFDFLPAGAALTERESYQSHAVWYRVLEILKTILGLIIATRLLFDLYDWRSKLIGSTPSPVSHGKIRRRRRTSAPSYVYGPKSESGSTAGVPEKVDPVDHADDSHIDR